MAFHSSQTAKGMMRRSSCYFQFKEVWNIVNLRPLRWGHELGQSRHRTDKHGMDRHLYAAATMPYKPRAG